MHVRITASLCRQKPPARTCGSSISSSSISVFRPRSSDHVRSPDHPILTTFCLRPSACDPTPHSTLLKTKAKPQFERTVDRTVEGFFRVFQPSNRAQFQACFPVLTVRSAEGRKPETTPYATQAFASSQRLGASSFIVKDHSPGTHFHPEINASLYHLFAFVPT